MKSHDCYQDPIIVRHERAGETATLHYCRSCGRVTSVSFEQRPPYIVLIPTIGSKEEEEAYREQGRLLDAFHRRFYEAAIIPLQAALEPFFGAAASEPQNGALVEPDPFEPYASIAWQDGDGMDDVHRTMRIWNEAGERAERRS